MFFYATSVRLWLWVSLIERLQIKDWMTCVKSFYLLLVSETHSCISTYKHTTRKTYLTYNIVFMILINCYNFFVVVVWVANQFRNYLFYYYETIFFFFFWKVWHLKSKNSSSRCSCILKVYFIHWEPFYVLTLLLHGCGLVPYFNA